MQKLAVIAITIIVLALASCGQNNTEHQRFGPREADAFDVGSGSTCAYEQQFFVNATQTPGTDGYDETGLEANLPTPYWVDYGCGGVSLATAHMRLPDSGGARWVEIGPYTTYPGVGCIFAEWSVAGQGTGFVGPICPPTIPNIVQQTRKYRIVNNAGIWRMQADLNNDGVFEGYATVPEAPGQTLGRPETEIEFFSNSLNWYIAQTHDQLRLRHLSGQSFQTWDNLACNYDHAWNWRVQKNSGNSWSAVSEAGAYGC